MALLVLMCHYEATHSLTHAVSQGDDTADDRRCSDDEESLGCSAQSLMCDELMCLSDDDTSCCPR